MQAQRQEEQEKLAREHAEEIAALELELAREIELERLEAEGLRKYAEEKRQKDLWKEVEEKEKEYVGKLDKRAGKRKILYQSIYLYRQLFVQRV